jgi:hypothetical protein
MPTRFTRDLSFFGGSRQCANTTDRYLVDGRISAARTAVEDLVKQGCTGPFHCLSIDGMGNLIAVTLNEFGANIYETQDICELVPPIHVSVIDHPTGELAAYTIDGVDTN